MEQRPRAPVMLPLLAVLLLTAPVRSYVFTCLDDCECDTEDEVVHCHNGERTELVLPAGQRLRGFPVIGMTYNNIHTLPNEATLLNKFPDLKIIDVERNPNFDCSTLDQYDRIKIISDCNKNITEIGKDCDMACQASKHYDKLHEYVLTLWEIVKEKYENFDMDTTLKQIQKFFTEVVSKINKMGRDIHASYKSNFHPKDVNGHPESEDQVATPEPDLVQIKKAD